MTASPPTLAQRGERWRRYLADIEAYAAVPQPLEMQGRLVRVAGLVPLVLLPPLQSLPSVLATSTIRAIQTSPLARHSPQPSVSSSTPTMQA